MYTLRDALFTFFFSLFYFRSIFKASLQLFRDGNIYFHYAHECQLWLYISVSNVETLDLFKTATSRYGYKIHLNIYKFHCINYHNKFITIPLLKCLVQNRPSNLVHFHCTL